MISKCLTIPYFDTVSAYALQASRGCKNLYECSRVLQDIGGPTGAERREDEASMVLDGKDTWGFKTTGFPLNLTCADVDEAGAKPTCGYILRDDVRKPVPSSAGLANVQNMLVNADDYATMALRLQDSLHNEIHNAIGGAMASFASPRDVVFFMHHANVDMLLYAYHQCHVGVPMTPAQKQQSRLTFAKRNQQCQASARRGVAPVDAQSTLIQNVVVDGRATDVRNHPTLGKYFGVVGDKMWLFADTRSLGDYSYTYDLPDVVARALLGNPAICKGVNAAANPTPSTTTPTAAPTPTRTQTQTPTTTTNATFAPKPVVTRALQQTTESAETTANQTQTRPATTATLANGTAQLEYVDWFDATFAALLARLDGNVAMAADQMQYVECLAFDEAFGLRRFSPAFVQNFGLASDQTQCMAKRDAVATGAVVLAVEPTHGFNATVV